MNPSVILSGDMDPKLRQVVETVRAGHPHISCWLLSHKRFPHAWNLLATDSANSVQGLTAARGDILVLWFDPCRTMKLASHDSKHLNPELLHAAECGGQAILDLLNTLYSKRDTDFSAIVAEVR